MALQSITNINVDFYDEKYTLINAKQFDRNSRVLYVTCYNHGEKFPINSGEHSAYIRYKKADDYSVFNFCEINRKGEIEVELTEQMLAADGVCRADLVITNKGKAKVDANTGEIAAIEDAAILSTKTFYIDVEEMAVENSEIESTYEFNLLNKTLADYEADYQNVIKTARSWAEGGTGIRNGEDEKNAKYYAELALKNAYGGDSIVTKIKGVNETDYRNGSVIISAENVGAIPIVDIATVEDVKGYLKI